MPPGLGKPTMESRFFIDYSWWEQSGKDITLHIQELCEEYGEADITPVVSDDDAEIDWVDPETAEVVRVDRPSYVFLNTCSRHPGFITEHTTLIEAIFRTLLAAGNRPMTPGEIAARIGRPAETILRILSGSQIYKGLRPYTSPE
jgi:hypothetical protein